MAKELSKLETQLGVEVNLFVNQVSNFASAFSVDSAGANDEIHKAKYVSEVKSFLMWLNSTCNCNEIWLRKMLQIANCWHRNLPPSDVLNVDSLLVLRKRVKEVGLTSNPVAFNPAPPHRPRSDVASDIQIDLKGIVKRKNKLIDLLNDFVAYSEKLEKKQKESQLLIFLLNFLQWVSLNYECNDYWLTKMSAFAEVWTSHQLQNSQDILEADQVLVVREPINSRPSVNAILPPLIVQQDEKNSSGSKKKKKDRKNKVPEKKSKPQAKKRKRSDTIEKITNVLPSTHQQKSPAVELNDKNRNQLEIAEARMNSSNPTEQKRASSADYNKVSRNPTTPVQPVALAPTQSKNTSTPKAPTISNEINASFLSPVQAQLYETESPMQSSNSLYDKNLAKSHISMDSSLPSSRCSTRDRNTDSLSSRSRGSRCENLQNLQITPEGIYNEWCRIEPWQNFRPQVHNLFNPKDYPALDAKYQQFWRRNIREIWERSRWLNLDPNSNEYKFRQNRQDEYIRDLKRLDRAFSSEFGVERLYKIDKCREEIGWFGTKRISYDI